MATLMFGSARIDENGNASGGAAGDQTGKEVSTQVMYTHSKGWYVFRPKKLAHATKIAKYTLRACNNSNVGYDQSNRLGIIKYGTNSKTKTECDCSSLMRQVIIEATGKDPGNFTTSTEATMLAATGLFETKFEYVSQSKTPLYNGDILVTKTQGHTGAIVSGNSRGSTSASKSSGSKPSYTKGATYTLQKALTVYKGPGTSYSKVGYSGLTTDGKKHDKNKDGKLDKGTVVTCKGTTTKTNAIWMKIPSGYVRAYYNGTTNIC